MRVASVLIAIAALGVVAGWCLCPPRRHRPPHSQASPPPPSSSATWPWTGVSAEGLHKGVRRWFLKSTPDGTTVELFEFDTAVNPKLRLELYDQDEDDATPFDNLADYFPRSVGTIVGHLNRRGGGRVVAAWNGPFFAYDFRHGGSRGMARHVGPVVLRGQAHYNVGNPRWTLGIKNGTGTSLAAIHHLDPKEAALRFDYAAAGLQCLVLQGEPLRLQPDPQPGDRPLPQPVPSSPAEAGHIPLVDHMRTSRTSLAWGRDGKRFFLLFVNEPDNELGSKLAVKRGGDPGGGWTLADLQRFWLAFGAWGAVNSDGGAVAQLAFSRPDGLYEMVPPRITSRNERLILRPDGSNAPEGGTLMSFYVIDTGAPASNSN